MGSGNDCMNKIVAKFHAKELNKCSCAQQVRNCIEELILYEQCSYSRIASGLYEKCRSGKGYSLGLSSISSI